MFYPINLRLTPPPIIAIYGAKSCIFLTLFLLLFFSTSSTASPISQLAYSPTVDSLPAASTVLRFEATGTTKAKKAVVRVQVFEAPDKEPIQGATVLLRRSVDSVHGKVTYGDGKCVFNVFPATYSVRVQMTGLQSLEQSGFVVEEGNVYDLDILMIKQ